ncbi:hypothetical protein PV327_004388 [Microctonus hyperodae]|uniref:Uncharacterized protein n=1 Tax=Microctonus hyperodae TaxID=165561 RepID=A0AA39FCA4_MICHY|nr:hypothetical protein PV327_004388 [Microctonus hyperodae]
MARYFILIMSLALLFVCYIQAAPSPLQAETSTVNNIEETFKKIADSFSHGLKNLMEDPKVGDFVKESQKFLENAAHNFQTEASKLIPKTDLNKN